MPLGSKQFKSSPQSVPHPPYKALWPRDYLGHYSKSWLGDQPLLLEHEPQTHSHLPLKLYPTHKRDTERGSLHVVHLCCPVVLDERDISVAACLTSDSGRSLTWAWHETLSIQWTEGLGEARRGSKEKRHEFPRPRGREEQKLGLHLVPLTSHFSAGICCIKMQRRQV